MQINQVDELDEEMKVHTHKEEKHDKFRKWRITLALILTAVFLSKGITDYLRIDDIQKTQQELIEIYQQEIRVKRNNENIMKDIKSITYNLFPESDHYYDPLLSEKLTTYYKKWNIKDVADFGCGKCDYVVALAKAGIKIQGYDGHPYIKDNKELAITMDLSQEVSLGKQYDFIQSFEVGEHIYSDFQHNFIQNLAKHAKKGIILSWSMYSQGGFLHVNNRQNVYIIERIQKMGFIFQKTDTEWFRKGFENQFSRMMVFLRD